MLFPNDHVRMLVELLRPADGEAADLLRRWGVALMTVPPAERRAVVEAVEQRIFELYEHANPRTTPDTALVHLAGEPAQREGFTEVIVRSFDTRSAPKKKPSAAGAKKGPRRSA